MPKAETSRTIAVESKVQSRVTYQRGYEPSAERKGGASETAVADARRYLDDLVFGRVPTDSAPDVIRALLADPEDVYTLEEHDEIVEELEREHKTAVDELTAERDLIQKERDTYHDRAETDGGKAEQFEDFIKTRELLEMAREDAATMRDKLASVRTQNETIIATAFVVALASFSRACRDAYDRLRAPWHRGDQ